MRGFIKNRIYTKLEDETGKLRIYGGAWSINLDDLGKKKINTIVYKTHKDVYSIDMKTAKHIGIKKNFKGENKLVVP